MKIELEDNGISFIREQEMPVYYKNHQVCSRRVDFLIQGFISVELKSITKLEDVHLAQALNYLEAYDLEVGLLLNFRVKSMQVKRIINRKFLQENQGNPEIK